MAQELIRWKYMYGITEITSHTTRLLLTGEQHRTNDVWDEQEFHTDKNNTVEINPSGKDFHRGYIHS